VQVVTQPTASEFRGGIIGVTLRPVSGANFVSPITDEHLLHFVQPSSCHIVICCCIATACFFCHYCSLVQTKNSEVDGRHPARLGTEQTLSPLVRVLVSFEHETSSFYMRHQNPYTVAT